MRVAVKLLLQDAMPHIVSASIARFTVNFFDENGRPFLAGKTIFPGNTVSAIEEPDKTSAGKRFDGWYAGDEYYDFSKPVTDNLSQWARYSLYAFPSGKDGKAVMVFRFAEPEKARKILADAGFSTLAEDEL